MDQHTSGSGYFTVSGKFIEHRQDNGHKAWNAQIILVRNVNPSLVLCNIACPSETHLKLKSHEISFVHIISFNCPISLKFCTEHGSDTAVLCAKFQLAWVFGKRGFARFEFKMSFGRISYIAPIPAGPWQLRQSRILQLGPMTIMYNGRHIGKCKILDT